MDKTTFVTPTGFKQVLNTSLLYAMLVQMLVFGSFFGVKNLT